MGAELGDSDQIISSRLQSRFDCSCPLDKKLHRGRTSREGGQRVIAASDAERANGKFLFLTDPQGFAAGHQQGQSWTSSNQLIEVDGGVDHLLEVIEQDETVLLAEVASKGLPDTRFALHND